MGEQSGKAGTVLQISAEDYISETGIEDEIEEANRGLSVAATTRINAVVEHYKNKPEQKAEILRVAAERVKAHSEKQVQAEVARLLKERDEAEAKRVIGEEMDLPEYIPLQRETGTIGSPRGEQVQVISEVAPASPSTSKQMVEAKPEVPSTPAQAVEVKPTRDLSLGAIGRWISDTIAYVKYDVSLKFGSFTALLNKHPKLYGSAFAVAILGLSIGSKFVKVF